LNANVRNHTNRDHREGEHNEAEATNVCHISLEDNREQRESAGRCIPMWMPAFANFESLAHELVKL